VSIMQGRSQVKRPASALAASKRAMERLNDGTFRTLAAGGLLLGSLVTGYLLATHDHGSVAPGSLAARVVPAPDEISFGSVGGGVEFVRPRELERPILLFVVSVDCEICARNMPHWVELTDDVRPLFPAPDQILAASLSGGEETGQYLEEHGLSGVPVLLLDPDQLSELGLRGTPTTVGITPDGSPMTIWEGTLSRDRQRDILEWASTAVRAALPH